MKNIFLAVVAACALSAVAEPRIYSTDLNVRDFGAKGDGVTDDTAAIQAASDRATKCAEAMRVGVAGRNCQRACQTDGPMPRLVFPAGTYLVSRPVFFRRDHQIYGFGGATVKAASSDIDVFVFVGTMRHFVTGLTMEGGARQFLVETHNSESANFKARDCVFRNASVTAVDSHSYRLPNAPDSKKRITVGTYRFDKEKGAWTKDERMNSPDLMPYNNSTYFSLERCAFYDCQRATDINPDGATFRALKVVSSVTTGCVFRVSNNLHAYDLDVTLARPKGSDDLAFIDYLGAHGLLLENSRFKSADDRGICLVHSSAKPAYIAHSLILRSLEVPCGGCPEGAIVQFRGRTTPEIVSVTDVNDVTERPVEAVSYADGMTADDLDAIRRFQQVPSDRTYSIAIGRNSPNVGDRLPPAVARYREPAADVPKAMMSLKVPPCPADGEVLWGPDFGLSEKASDDDTAAMKRLLEEAASRRRTTVVLPPRRIVLKEPVTVSGEVTVTAAGIALIEAADDCDIFRVESGSRVLLSHLFFRNGRRQLVCEASSDTTVVLDHCFSFDAADTAFVMTAEKGTRLKFLADGGVHYHPRWYEGNANAILAGAWLRTLPPKPYGEPFTESVSVVNRGKLRFQDILGVPCVFAAIPKGSQAPAGDYRWIDNIGGELNAVFTRFGAEWGGMPPVYNSDGGKVLIEGSYAYFYPRYTAHAAVLTDREPVPGDIRLFGISCGMEVQLWYGGAQVLVRAKPGDEPKPVRSALRRCLVPKAEPCVTGAGKSPLRLERGRTEVVIAADAPAIVRYAADEATNLLAKILGAPVPLVNRASDGSTPVYLGEGAWTKDAGLDVSGFARDEYAMRTFGSGVVLVGRDGTDPDPFPKPTRQFREFCWQSQVERASLFALYDFLERYAGARFYFPGELGTILPRTDRIVVTDAEFRSKPDFQVRRFGYRDGTIPKAILDEFGGDPVAVRRVEFNRLRMETKYFPCCHGLNKFEYLKRFGKTHPEYFALNAQGVRNTSGAGHIGQVCYSSPIAEVIYEDVKAYLTGQPSASRGIEPRWGSNCIGDVVDVMSQDGMFPCSCAACQSRYDFAHGPNYATEFIWSNTVAIANRLTREGVKGTITQMAYRPYRSVPKTVEIPDNVAVMVAETGPWTLADEKVFAAQTDEIRAWAEKLGRKVWTWNYTCKATSTGLNIPGIPSTTPRAVGEYYKRIAPYVFGAFTETSSVDRWLYNHLNYYVFSRVMWDKSSDVDAILEEYYRLMYGPAAPEMKEFFESLEEKWAKHVAGVFRDSSVGPKAAPPTDAEMYGEVYSPAVRARYRELFRAAEAKAAGDSLVLRRLKLMRDEFLDPIDVNAAEYEARKVRLAAFVVPGGKDMEPQALSYLDIGGKAKTPKIKDLRTTFRAWFEKGMLRIVVECAEPYMDKRMNAPFKDEISVTADDCLELYVNPSGDRRRCFNFVVSSEGLLADAKFTKVGSAIGAIAKDYGWNSGFTAKVTRRSDGWTADVTIPQKALKGISASEGRIPLNVCRSRQVDDGLRGGNYYVWGDFVKGFPDVQNFGTVLFYEGRIRAIDPVKAGELRLRPTFVSCGVSYGIGSDRPVAFAYRRRGDATWRKGLQPPYFAETRDVRGSLLGLDEDADYEVRVLVEGRVAAEGAFRTWSSDVPIAKTVEIDPAQVDFPITVTDRGTPDGWIRYRVKPGCALDNRTDRACFVVEDASYVTIDDSVIRGCASRHAIEIVRSDHVRVRNCDVSGWGRVGRQKFAREGRFYPVKKSQDPRWNGIINYDGAIEIGEANRAVVVERCWIHDPNGQANSWRYSHPAGPEAITVKSPDHSTVIRWCDFTGSDEHRWNDAVESLGNFDERGGFNRDADVYGNFMNLCNDDCIELDGGQQNVRCFGNRFESALCGVSIQGNMVSPSYVYDNLFSGMGDRFGECGQTIKTSSVDPEMKGSWCLIHDNVLWGGGSGLRLESVWKRTRYDVRRNRFCGGQRLEGCSRADRPGNLRAEGNVLGDALAERDLDPAYPRRPLAFVLDRVRLTDAFEGAPTSFVVRAVSSAREPIPFSIAKNGAFGWFDVSPSSGRIPAQGQVALTVTPNAARMGERRFWRGAFLVRTPEGLSRPFSFELENRAFMEPFRCEKPGELAVYADVEPFELGAEREFAFTWPKDARGFFLLRLAGAMNAPYEVSVDGAPWSVSSVQGFPGLANWSIVSTRGELWQGRISFFDLKAGRHTLKVRALGEPKKGFPSGPIRVEGAVLTDSPGSFEPR